MGRFLCSVRVASHFWNGSVLGVYTLLKQDRSEMHFRFRCYRTPRPDAIRRQRRAGAVKDALGTAKRRTQGVRP